MADPQKTDFDPSVTSGTHTELLDSWTLARDFAEMLYPVLLDGTYLDEFAKGTAASEAASQYTWRKNASLALDHCADLISLRVDNIFRSAPVRSFDDSPHAEFIAEFLANVDGGGTSMDVFIRRHLPMHYALGTDFVVDKQHPPAGVEATNLAQERALGLVPYVHAFSPIERLDWSVDHAGRYLWTRYDLGIEGYTDELGGDDPVHHYLTLTPTEWRLYSMAGDDQDRETTVETGTHTLQVCPVVPFYFKESMRADYRKVPLGLLTRVAPIARYLLNLVSQIQIDIYRSIAFLVATGVEADQIPAEITPMGCWALPEGAALDEVSGSTDQITAKIVFAQVLTEAILRIGKLTDNTGELKSRAASGVQVAVERTDLDNEMRMTAVQLEQTERDIVWLAVCRHTGKLVDKDDLGYSVEYNKKYVLTPVAELVRQAREFASMGYDPEVPSLQRLMLKKVLDSLVTEDDEEYQTAIDELEAATFDGLGVDGDAGLEAREEPDANVDAEQTGMA